MSKINKIEIYTEISLENAFITEHAVDQALDRFNLKDKNRQKVASWIRKKLEHSTFRSTVRSERYGIARLFENDGIGLVLDLHKDTVITVYKMEARPVVKSKIRDFMTRERNKIARVYSKKQRSYNLRIAELNIQKATLQRDLLRARSEVKQNVITARVNAIDTEVASMMKELCDLQTEKSEFELSLDTI